MQTLTLKEIQSVELEILLEFQSICKKNKLRFYLCGGTMLGAARHKGFIPWDDDVDIMMPRPDYNRLIEVAKNEKLFSHQYCLYAYELGNAEYPFAKLVNMNSHIVQEYVEDESLSHIWIDIMPVDGLPERDEEVSSLYKKMGLIRKIIMLCWAKPGKATSLQKMFGKIILTPGAKLVGAKTWCLLMNSLALKNEYNTSKYVGVLTWGLYGTREKCLREEFDKSVEVEFEGHLMPAVSCWNQYLTNLYGNYMILPPEDKRKIHALEAWLD